jgi:hypothetical protein
MRGDVPEEIDGHHQPQRRDGGKHQHGLPWLQGPAPVPGEDGRAPGQDEGESGHADELGQQAPQPVIGIGPVGMATLAADPVGLVFAARASGPELAGLPEPEVGGLGERDARAPSFEAASEDR